MVQGQKEKPFVINSATVCRWYLDLQWVFLLVIHILNADSDKLHGMGEAEESHSSDADSNPSSTSRDLERAPLTCQMSLSSCTWETGACPPRLARLFFVTREALYQ